LLATWKQLLGILQARAGVEGGGNGGSKRLAKRSEGSIYLSGFCNMMRNEQERRTWEICHFLIRDIAYTRVILSINPAF